MYPRIIKPTLDILGAIVLLVAASPLMIVIVVMQLMLNHGKVFFFQERPGMRGRIFTLIKFSTMNDRKDAHGKLLPDRDRLTDWGRIMRKLSLDELPQLLNVLMGQMSFVGPRPLLKQYLGLYNDRQMRRHLVKPGITGWAQVNGRNSLSWQDKFEHDVWYVDHISFRLDLRIILLTFAKVLRSEGVHSRNAETMENFTGN